MPTPRKNEDKQSFISRCIPYVMDDGTADNQEQAAAICNSIWDNKETKGKLLEYIEIINKHGGPLSNEAKGFFNDNKDNADFIKSAITVNEAWEYSSNK